ncbi:MAG: MFS transporter [Oxalicibacterium faecigallinarum]|uniref:MFS transporter n=1 Tax=Oxalicibacterium faecigallinarum TaxID=573741 RepID=UPI0028074F03|nr:MFS transporter [Oxalicibacterium faecigallinarum]MDQ7969869.1 MFS transporter [Oxalicibacterium faecigallinarum]
MQAIQSTHSDIPRLTIPALSLAAFGSAISLRVTDPLLPRLASEFGVSLGQVAYVITAFSIAYGVSQLFFGPVGDRFGKYFVIAWACMACALTALLCALAPNYPLLIVARLLAGATAAAIIPLSMAWIGDVIPYKERQPVLAQFLIGQIIGISAGVLLGGFTADHLSWRVPFFLLSFCFVLISLTLFAFNRRLPARALTTHRAEGSAVRRMFNEFSLVLQRPWSRVVLATVFLEGAFLYGAFAFIASHLHHVHHLSLTRAAGLVMLFGLGGFLYAISSRRLVRGLGEKGLVHWGGLLVMASLLIISLAPVWWWTIPACFVCGLGFYMLHNTLQINATQMAPERRGAAVSIFASCFFLGQSAGVSAAGWAIGHFGTTVVIAIGAVGVLLVALNFARLKID